MLDKSGSTSKEAHYDQNGIFFARPTSTRTPCAPLTCKSSLSEKTSLLEHWLSSTETAVPNRLGLQGADADAGDIRDCGILFFSLDEKRRGKGGIGLEIFLQN